MNEQQEKKLDELLARTERICDNHLSHVSADIANLNETVGRLSIMQAMTSTNVDWLMRAMWWVIGLIVAGNVAGIVTRII